jgi:hypothetical protein
MATDFPGEKTLANKEWIAIRFIVFGVGGFMLMFISWLMLFVFVFEPENTSFAMSPLLSLPLGVSGSLMMLYGVGEWGRWVYLFVFLSIPLSFSLLSMLPSNWNSKDLGLLFPAIAATISYGVVRRFYQRRNPPHS